MKGSFSIDSLLAKKTETRHDKTPPPTSPPLTSPRTMTSPNGSSNPSTPSPSARSSPEALHGKTHNMLKAGLAPRPGLLSPHQQMMLQSNPLALQGLLQAQYLNALNGHAHQSVHGHGGHGHPVHGHGLHGSLAQHGGHGGHTQIPNSSAFHSPGDHVFKMAAHLHGGPGQGGHVPVYMNDWMTRGGMLVSRMMDYTGISCHFCFK